MDLSIGARYLVLLTIFFIGCAVVFGNLKLLWRIVARRKIHRAELVWPFLALVIVLCAIDAFLIEPNAVLVSHHKIASAKLRAGSRIRIVHVSDLHSEHVGRRERRMFMNTARAHPDVIVITGDLTNGTGEHVKVVEEIGAMLSKIAPTYAVEGNWDSTSDLQALERGGATLLKDWTRIKGKRGAEIEIGQVLWSERNARSYAKDRSSRYRVLLSHVPWLFDTAAGPGVDLMLVGHTHGGQVRLPILGALLPSRELVGTYQEGFYRKNGSRLFVNRGLGMEGGALEVRFFCRPEIAVIDIRSSRKP